ncbi:hypothetical protein IFM89_032336 [Coptis chinensis]|uniref:Uncharacterized protein n=1 Tax=Coptis chinensis TaxID=261450 RepID=A0A835IJH4_9MAGN|nr:hypothetical protein IFM89_032336 [Coptis chinensis]
MSLILILFTPRVKYFNFLTHLNNEVVSIIENAAFVHGEPSQDDNKGPPRVDSEAIILHEKVTKTIIKEGCGENLSKYSTCFYIMVCDEVIKLSLKLYNAIRMRDMEMAMVDQSRAKFCLSSQNRTYLRAQHRDTYVIFGEAKIEDLSSQLQTQVAEQFKTPDLSHVISKPESSTMAQDDNEDVDETGVEPKDRISDDAGLVCQDQRREERSSSGEKNQMTGLAIAAASMKSGECAFVACGLSFPHCSKAMTEIGSQNEKNFASPIPQEYSERQKGAANLNFERATRIVDQRGVKRISGEPSGRCVFQVWGTNVTLSTGKILELLYEMSRNEDELRGRGID